jgi:hypothetical protein
MPVGPKGSQIQRTTYWVSRALGLGEWLSYNCPICFAIMQWHSRAQMCIC